MEKWITLKEEIKLKAREFKYVQVLRKSPDSGKEGQFDRLDCSNWVNVVARTKEGTFVLVRQYRQGTDTITDEIPGGAIDPGEDPLVAAKRELLEETGYEAKTWKLLGVMDPNPAILSNKCHVFFADEAERVASQNLDFLEEKVIGTCLATRGTRQGDRKCGTVLIGISCPTAKK